MSSARAGGNCSWCGAAMDADEATSKPCDRCFNAWPKCAIPACVNKCCLRLGSKFCWPHTPGTDLGEVLESLEGDDMTDDEMEEVYDRRSGKD